tara:strand:- start:13183 stop:13980 length:798 start_codon:yes stop_codon:yes gene_type:complete
MRFRHNKKRNTAFLYEALIMELSRASLNEDVNKKNQIINLLKEYFSNGKSLKKDLEIYKSFENIEDMRETMLHSLIMEAKYQFNSLDRKTIFNTQTKLINEINKRFGVEFWENFVSNYKKLATLNQILNKSLSPKHQVVAEQKLVESLSKKEEKKPFPNVNNLAINNFINKFNDQYQGVLSESQRNLLEKYIMSYNEHSEFKIFLYEEIDRLKESINKKINQSDEQLSEKLQKVLYKVNNYNNRKIDQVLIGEVIKIQSLVEEIN